MDAVRVSDRHSEFRVETFRTPMALALLFRRDCCTRTSAPDLPLSLSLARGLLEGVYSCSSCFWTSGLLDRHPRTLSHPAYFRFRRKLDRRCDTAYPLVVWG
jgi:hypothetical protein